MAEKLKTKIFLDGGDPQETREIIKLLGFLDGQTTNPTLISKNPQARERFEKGEKFTKGEIFSFYRNIISEISALVLEGSVSIEVYSDSATSTDEMFEQGKEMFTWISNPEGSLRSHGAGAHIKYPITKAGLGAAERSIKEGMRVNMTLCFTQEQAAAMYTATMGAKKGDVFVSPFVGRLDDRGEDGMELISNIIEMYRDSDHHVEVLTASVRTLDHLLYGLSLGSDIITAPFKILRQWGEKGILVPDENFKYQPELRAIPYKQVDLSKNWNEYNISHDLTDKGIQRFSEDWNQLLRDT